jgi:hypothetical protein
VSDSLKLLIGKTIKVYLSCADMTLPRTKTASTTAMITISQDEILVMAHSPLFVSQVQWRSSFALRWRSARDVQFPV